ncbi:MAG: TolC family protein, partial [Synechococcales bacterium]|nr:TolC family protein [Synechococcales bacterium]
ITAADPVEVAGTWELSLEESVVLAYKNRAELEQQLVQREIDQQQRRAAIAAIRPQLSMFGQWQTTDLLDTTRTTGDQEEWQVGLQLNWLLYDGGAARARARQEEFDAAIAESDFADTREEIRFDVEEAFFSLESNFENIQTAAVAVDLAEEALRLARLRFQAGVGIQSDVIQAQTDLTEAEVNLVDAILGYNRALVNIERAVSNLPNNNLTDVP